MKTLISAALLGALFGLGLVLSGMTDTGKVQGFLDLTGQWDPTLAFVMGGALLVTVPGFFWLRGRGRVADGSACNWPTAKHIDRRLLGGAALFGIGWGMVGLCPGPLLAGLAYGQVQHWIMLPAMALGLWLSQRLFPAR